MAEPSFLLTRLPVDAQLVCLAPVHAFSSSRARPSRRTVMRTLRGFGGRKAVFSQTPLARVIAIITSQISAEAYLMKRVSISLKTSYLILLGSLALDPTLEAWQTDEREMSPVLKL